jgi:hypothetical protein
MAGFIGVAEMEMEMEMEMGAGAPTPFPSASPVLRPIGVSPTVGVSATGDYRGNRWPPVPRPEELDRAVRAAPDKVTVRWGERVNRLRPAAAMGDEQPLLPERQWASRFYSIAVVGEFVNVSINLPLPEGAEEKEFFDRVMPIEKILTWNNIDLMPELFLPNLLKKADIDEGDPKHNNNGNIRRELEELIKLMDYRPSVLSEALAQRNGIDDYFRGTLSFTPSSHPCTFGLMQIALRVGEFQVMHYKYQFNRPRPSQVCPWLMPPIEVPGHASYPSGHATQAHLVALILGEVMPLPPAGRPKPLRLLAERIARNREVLGLHYPSDSIAGAKLAKESFLLLRKCKTVRAMVPEARREWRRPEGNNLPRTIENMEGLG